MDTDKIRIFLSVVKTRNFTTTADDFGYTQSAVSQSIKKLEETLGIPLFIRNHKNIIPTPNAIEIYPYMKEFVKAEDNLLQSVQSLVGLDTGTISIGTFASVSAHWLPAIIQEFHRDYPHIHIQLVDSTYCEIENLLEIGELDLGFIMLPTTANVDYKPLPPEKYMAVLPKGHPLCALDIVPLTELLKEQIINPADNFKNEIGSYIEKNNIYVDRFFSSKDDYITMSMVRNGFGVSILPELVLKDFTDLVETRPLDPPFYRTLGIAAKSFNNCSPACTKFLNYHNNIYHKELLSVL